MRCPSCGTENPEGSRFCMSCASPLMAFAPSAAPVPPMPVAPPMPFERHPMHHLRHREPHEDLVGLLGLAFVLVAVSAVFAWNANLPSELQRWTQMVSAANTIFIRPPEGIILSAAWFFTAMGLFEILSGGLRWALRWRYLRVAGRFLAAVGNLVFASLLFLYSAHTISGLMMGAILAGTVGMFLMIFVTLGLYWSSARPAPAPAPVQPPTRQ